ncbi:MAG TPA: FtsQ-type POTRA domain-containing protein [Thermoleophilaceae bacterium]|nr:FtsQ-type POTRA domain-containing protein [Thermoleophilaceae bacterium]
MISGAATVAGRLRASLPKSPRAGGRVRAMFASQRLRRYLLILAAALLLLGAGYQFWLRDSSLVAVEDVTVTGLTTSDSKRVRMALTAASRSMTTLHVDHDALERAVAGFPVVRELEVTTDFPHGLNIHVVEHVPAAVAVGESGRVAVAGDGTILQGVPVEKRLPTVEVEGAVGVERLRDPTALASAAIAGAAPAELRGRLSEVGEDGRLGQVAQLRNGPEVIFGDATRVRAKWAAAATVLADLEASGASYVDVRLPDRPAAGGLPAETIVPVAPAGTTSTVPPGTTTDPAAATTVDPTAAGTEASTGAAIPPTGAAPPTDGTVPAPATAPAPGTVTQTTPPAPTASPAPTTPAPAPTAPVTDGTGGGAATAPSP